MNNPPPPSPAAAAQQNNGFSNVLIACHFEKIHGAVFLADEDGVFPLSDKIMSEDEPYKQYLTSLKQLPADKVAEYKIRSVSYVDIGFPEFPVEEYKYTSKNGLPIKQYNRWENIPDESVDIVYALYCDDGINDSLAELYRVLKPGGKLMVIGNELEHRGDFEGGKRITYDYATANGMFVLTNKSFLYSRIDSGRRIGHDTANTFMSMHPHYLFVKPLRDWTEIFPEDWTTSVVETQIGGLQIYQLPPNTKIYAGKDSFNREKHGDRFSEGTVQYFGNFPVACHYAFETESGELRNSRGYVLSATSHEPLNLINLDSYENLATIDKIRQYNIPLYFDDDDGNYVTKNGENDDDDDNVFKYVFNYPNRNHILTRFSQHDIDNIFTKFICKLREIPGLDNIHGFATMNIDEHHNEIAICPETLSQVHMGREFYKRDSRAPGKLIEFTISATEGSNNYLYTGNFISANDQTYRIGLAGPDTERWHTVEIDGGKRRTRHRMKRCQTRKTKRRRYRKTKRVLKKKKIAYNVSSTNNT